MSAREIEAYRKRLAKISAAESSAPLLTTECLGAVVEYWDADAGVSGLGTLVAYTQRHGLGLLGPRQLTDIRVCSACVGRAGNCDPRTTEIEIPDALVLSIHRNEPGVEQVAS